MIQLFRKKSEKINDFSFLGVDMHSHVLPGIDDGPSNINESLILLQELSLIGFSKLIPTPHIMESLYPNSFTTISESYNSVLNFDQENIMNIPQIDSFSAEYYLDSNFANLRKTQKLLTFGNNNVLIEMSYADYFPNLENEIYNLLLLGYQPILAHPERYAYFHNNKEYYHKLVNMGCHLQLNLLSLTNHYGNNIRNMARYLLKSELYHWAGTDVHSLKHVQLLKQLLSDKLMKEIKIYPFYNKLLF